MAKQMATGTRAPCAIGAGNTVMQGLQRREG